MLNLKYWRAIGLLTAIALATPIVLRAENLAPATSQAPATQPLAVKVTVTVDTSKAPELADWAEKARVYAEHWYPLIADRLASDGFTPPAEVKLIFTPDYKGVAATTGTIITISSKYVNGHLDDFGMVAHEITHVIQHYRRARAGWLVEGIADYIRYYFVEPGSPRAHFNFSKSNWNSAYQPSAGFLDYLERTFPDKHVVTTLNTALRQGKYKEELIQQLTGKTPDELWSDYKASADAK